MEATRLRTVPYGWSMEYERKLRALCAELGVHEVREVKCWRKLYNPRHSCNSPRCDGEWRIPQTAELDHMLMLRWHEWYLVLTQPYSDRDPDLPEGIVCTAARPDAPYGAGTYWRLIANDYVMKLRADD